MYAGGIYFARVMEFGIHVCLRSRILGVRVSSWALSRIDGTEYMEASNTSFSGFESLILHQICFCGPIGRGGGFKIHGL